MSFFGGVTAGVEPGVAVNWDLPLLLMVVPGPFGVSMTARKSKYLWTRVGDDLGGPCCLTLCVGVLFFFFLFFVIRCVSFTWVGDDCAWGFRR